MHYFTWIVAAIALVGVVLNIRKDPRCFILWGFTNYAWAYVDLFKGIYAQALLQLVYFFLSVYGYMTWKAEEKVVVDAHGKKEVPDGEIAG